jgi:hypothetical protein
VYLGGIEFVSRVVEARGAAVYLLAQGCLSAVRDVAYWPLAALAALLRNVGYWGTSGLIISSRPLCTLTQQRHRAEKTRLTEVTEISA